MPSSFSVSWKPVATGVLLGWVVTGPGAYKVAITDCSAGSTLKIEQQVGSCVDPWAGFVKPSTDVGTPVVVLVR